VTVGRAIYSATAGAAVALVAGVAKTALGIITPAQFGADARKLRIGFDGVTSTDKAVLVELVAYTADGTGTAATVNQTGGRTITPGFTAKYNYSVEPTGGSVLDAFTLTPIGGTVLIELGDDIDVGASAVLGVRLTAPTNPVTARPTLFVARC
jgi:hypothetical protein